MKGNLLFRKRWGSNSGLQGGELEVKGWRGRGERVRRVWEGALLPKVAGGIKPKASTEGNQGFTFSLMFDFSYYACFCLFA